MKKWIVTVLAVAACSGAFAQSKIEKSTLENQSTNKKVINAAIGDKAIANTGAINVDNSEVLNSTIRNKSHNEMVINAAIGKDATANTGSVNVQ